MFPWSEVRGESYHEMSYCYWCSYIAKQNPESVNPEQCIIACGHAVVLNVHGNAIGMSPGLKYE